MRRSPDGMASLGVVLVITAHLAIAGEKNGAGCHATPRTGGGRAWVRFVAVATNHFGLASTLDAESTSQTIRMDSNLKYHDLLRKYYSEAGGSSS